MINFVVVEDNANHRKSTKDIILNYMMKNKYEFDILFFERETDTFIELVENHDSNYIYILDFLHYNCQLFLIYNNCQFSTIQKRYIWKKKTTDI